MNSQLTVNLLRVFFIVFTTYVGVMIGGEEVAAALSGGAAGASFGLLIVLADRLMKGISLRLFSAATFGLFVGTLAAKLFLGSGMLLNASGEVQWITSLAIYAAFGYLGMMLAIRSNADEFALVIPYVRFRRNREQQEPVIVDSNIILDGRISAVCGTGFLTNCLIVPRFVLDELQTLADSADPAKRERGRLALDRLQQMQGNPALQVKIHDTGPEEDPMPTDSRLTRLARVLSYPLLTNDSNLCATARLQGVQALNLNELANAIRPMLNMGDELELTLTKEGREAHQAVGYLQDGTMIVVNHGRPLIGNTVHVAISGTLQTNAGRLLFAEIRKRGVG
jgi:uncharacterized protein YacL